MALTTLALNAREELRIERAERAGKRYIDIRVYASAAPDEAKWPTGKGVLIPEERFQAFRQAVASIQYE